MFANRNFEPCGPLPCTAAVVLLAQLLLSAPSSAQQVLNYGRAACNGPVSVATAREPKMMIGNLANATAAVSSNRIVWQCDNGAPQTFECPPSTNMVQIDRRQGGVNFSILCLRR